MSNCQNELNAVKALFDEINNEYNEFLYCVSHDLKSPLRAINNYAHFLVEDLGDRLDLKDTNNADINQYLDGLQNAVKEADNLLNGLLILSRLGRNNLYIETLDVGDLLADLINTLQVTSVIDLKGPWPKMEVEFTLFSSIFEQLILNADKFNRSLDKRIKIGCKSVDEKNYEFYVKDNGIGIDYKNHSKIFTAFQRLNSNEYKGYGVGLSIVKKAVSKLQGSIRVESELGKGSTFYIRLPITVPDELKILEKESNKK